MLRSLITERPKKLGILIKKISSLPILLIVVLILSIISCKQEPKPAKLRPNILFLMTDQMQGRVLDPDHVCQTPNLDSLAQRGARFTQAYTPNPVCSPARASLMTGLLPHSHGVVQVTHCTPDDQSVLREKPHWAQRLLAAGYRTGYFGKWHVERSNDLQRFGWEVNGYLGSDIYSHEAERLGATPPRKGEIPFENLTGGPEGYPRDLLYAISEKPRALTGDVSVALAQKFLNKATEQEQPWLCFVSILEPHDPFVTSREAYERYDVASIPVPPNWNDPLDNRPGYYRKAARAFNHLTEKEKKEAAAAYFASITEIDTKFQTLIDLVESKGQLDRTIIILTSDHGELLGAHGLYMKNAGAFEEAYNVPLIMAGPGIANGAVSEARVGLQDLAPTILDLVGLETIGAPDSRSFEPVLKNPEKNDPDYSTGYAEYYGTRYWLSQRILWDGPWKLVWNGFDFDELYNLDEDPYELQNLSEDPAYQNRLRLMMTKAWEKVRETNDWPLLNATYPGLRVAPFGPKILDSEATSP